VKKLRKYFRYNTEDIKRETFTVHTPDKNHITEVFERDNSFESIEDDLDEGYAQNHNISRPEHTPEAIQSKTEPKRENTPKKQELSSNIQQKLDDTSYQTQDALRQTQELRSVSRNTNNRLLKGKTSKRYKRKYNKRNHKSMSSLHMTKPFNERMKQFELIKQEHMLIRKEEISKRELKECTFRPRIRSNRSFEKDKNHLNASSKPRNIDEFIKDQHNFEQKKFLRLEELSKERDRTECKTFRPKIDKKSRIMTNAEKDSINAMPVHKRLHDLAKRRCRNNVQSSLALTKINNKSMLSFNNTQLKQNYITEQFKINDLLNSRQRRCRSKNIKRKNMHNELYDDAVKRKSRQDKLENQNYVYKNQSIRSFLKHTHGSFCKTNNQTISSKILKKDLERNSSSKKKNSSNGVQNCKSYKTLDK
jgi:hypothetical protein